MSAIFSQPTPRSHLSARGPCSGALAYIELVIIIYSILRRLTQLQSISQISQVRQYDIKRADGHIIKYYIEPAARP